jgi:hypothetical protein
MAQQRFTGVETAGNRVMEYFRDSDSMIERMSALACCGSESLVYGRSNGMHYVCYRGTPHDVAKEGGGDGVPAKP